MQVLFLKSDKIFHNYLNIIPLKLNNRVQYGKPDIKNFSFTKFSIIKTLEIHNSSIASAIVTNPINKYTMHKSGLILKAILNFLHHFHCKRKIP